MSACTFGDRSFRLLHASPISSAGCLESDACHAASQSREDLDAAVDGEVYEAELLREDLFVDREEEGRDVCREAALEFEGSQLRARYEQRLQHGAHRNCSK